MRHQWRVSSSPPKPWSPSGRKRKLHRWALPAAWAEWAIWITRKVEGAAVEPLAPLLALLDATYTERSFAGTEGAHLTIQQYSPETLPRPRLARANTGRIQL